MRTPAIVVALLVAATLTASAQTRIQIRRGPTAELAAQTPAEGELWYDTTLKRLVLGDGATLGGGAVLENRVAIDALLASYAALGHAHAAADITSGALASARIAGATATTGYVPTVQGDGSVEWAAPAGGGGTWGSITGTLADQTDLQTALDGKQAAAANLTTYAGITPSANVQSLLGAVDYATMRGLLDLEAGTDFYSVSGANAAFAAASHAHAAGDITSGTLGVTRGGTGVASATAFAVLAGGTTGTGAFQSVSGLGSSGQVLTSAGAGALPTWQDAAGGGEWGSITGTLANQTDLQSALDGKQVAAAALTTYAGITPSANVQSVLGAADYSAIRTLLGLVIGTNVQAFDADLSVVASSCTTTGTVLIGGTPVSCSATPTVSSLTATGGTTNVLNLAASLVAATGNEVAYTLAYTSNKATSGNDTGLVIAHTDTASPGTSYALNIITDGTRRLSIHNSGILDSNDPSGQFRFYYQGGGVLNLLPTEVRFPQSALALGGTTDLYVHRDAADTWAQRRTTNAQTGRIYNTWTDASNGEWAKLSWVSSVFRIGATKNGSGTARVLSLDYGGTSTSAISIPITSGDITFGGSLRPTGYKSADGTAGVTVSSCTGFKDGLCISGT